MFATIKSLIPEPRQAEHPRHYVGRHRRADPVQPPVPVSPVSPAPPVSPAVPVATPAPLGTPAPVATPAETAAA
jgi:hypothetical protein